MRKTWKSYKTSSPIALRTPKKKSGLGGYCCSRKRRRSGPKDYTRNQGQMEEPAIQSTAKRVRKEQKKTGGGPAPPNPSEATLKIIEIFSETPSFTGLQGFETGRFAGGNIYFCGYLKCNEKRILYRLIFHPCCVKNFAARRQEKKKHICKIMRMNMIRQTVECGAETQARPADEQRRCHLKLDCAADGR